MEAYVLDKMTFKPVAHYPVAEYALYLGTATDAKGSVNIPKEIADVSGNWLKINNNIWYIESSAPNKGQTVLRTADPVDFFNRTLFYDKDTTYNTTGSFISQALQANFVEQEDEEYQYPYINIVDKSSTAFFEPELEDDTYNIGEYIKTAENAGIKLEFTCATDGLKIKIVNAVRKTSTVFLNTGVSQLESSSFTSAVYAKVTVRKPVLIENSDPDAEDEYEYEDTVYYFDKSGNISTTVPEDRAKGKWEIIVCKDDDEPMDIARQLFEDNSFSYKLSFWSFERFNLYDSVVMMLPTGKFKAVISEVKKTSDDERYYYQCGQKTTTLTETVRAVTSTISGEAQVGENTTALAAYPVGSIYMSVLSVSPAALFGGTWKQIQGKFLLGASSEFPNGTTGGEKEHILTVDEMPAHTHAGITQTGSYDSIRGATNSGGNTTGSAGGGKAHNNMPPYMSVYIWERTG